MRNNNVYSMNSLNNIRKLLGDFNGIVDREEIFKPTTGVFTQCKNCNLETRSRDYATIEESSIFRAVRVAPQTLLRSAEVNTFLVARRHRNRLDDTRVWRGHVTSACSTVTEQ
jgi:hypothetical protein